VGLCRECDRLVAVRSFADDVHARRGPDDRGKARPDQNLVVDNDLVRIAAGGFSTVYTAYQESLGRTVAVKVLIVGDDEDVRRRFLREVKLTGRLTGHPNVVTVLDAGTTLSGEPYLATDLYDSHSYLRIAYRMWVNGEWKLQYAQPDPYLNVANGAYGTIKWSLAGPVKDVEWDLCSFRVDHTDCTGWK
jgi:hypothetical protein